MHPNKPSPDHLTVSQAAQLSHVTRQAIYSAIRSGRLTAIVHQEMWYVTTADLETYRISKYNRDLRKLNGEYVFDLEKGHFSVQQVAKVMSAALGRSYPAQHLYYLLRSGYLQAFRVGKTWVIKKEDAIALLEEERGTQKCYMRM